MGFLEGIQQAGTLLYRPLQARLIVRREHQPDCLSGETVSALLAHHIYCCRPTHPVRKNICLDLPRKRVGPHSGLNSGRANFAEYPATTVVDMERLLLLVLKWTVKASKSGRGSDNVELRPYYSS
jgi:hypothetical protein